jgi:GNAT superfamily N-acetyltransferase
MSNRIRQLEPADAPQALALSQAAGWQQTIEDWRLAIEMNPGGCFAMEMDGTVVATTTSIRYGTVLAWIGMVLTHPEFRGRGYARALIERVLDHLGGVETAKLDATEMGAPLYRQLGFVEECAIERWIGKLSTAPIEAQSFTYPAFDQEAFGADRRVLLERLAKIESASLEDAFAMGRGNRFGPCAACSNDYALWLAKWFLARHPDEPIVWDLFPENNLAQSLGFEFSRRLTRMTRPQTRSEPCADLRLRRIRVRLIHIPKILVSIFVYPCSSAQRFSATDAISSASGTAKPSFVRSTDFK